MVGRTGFSPVPLNGQDWNPVLPTTAPLILHEAWSVRQCTWTRCLEAFLRSWPFDPWLIGGILLTAGIYLRGWLVFVRRGSLRWARSQLFAFLGGLTAVWLALASPIDPFSTLLLLVHMVQHLLLMMVAPPLLWLGAADAAPPPRPTGARAALLGWTASSPGMAAELLPTADATAGGLGSVCRFRLGSGTHLPFSMPRCVRSAGTTWSTWFFWGPLLVLVARRSTVSQPAPVVAWVIVPYLFLADLQNTALSALLAFSDRVIYPHYETVPRIGGVSALEDQSIAGVLMWVPGSLAFLLPLVWIGCQLLYGQTSRTRGQGSGVRA